MADHDVDLPRLREQLCVKLGFCLEPVEWQRIVHDPPTTADAFTDEVIVGEGMDPVTINSGLRRQVRDRVRESLWPEEVWPLRVLAVEEGQCVHDWTKGG